MGQTKCCQGLHPRRATGASPALGVLGPQKVCKKASRKPGKFWKCLEGEFFETLSRLLGVPVLEALTDIFRLVRDFRPGGPRDACSSRVGSEDQSCLMHSVAAASQHLCRIAKPMWIAFELLMASTGGHVINVCSKILMGVQYLSIFWAPRLASDLFFWVGQLDARCFLGQLHVAMPFFKHEKLHAAMPSSSLRKLSCIAAGLVQSCRHDFNASHHVTMGLKVGGLCASFSVIKRESLAWHAPELDLFNTVSCYRPNS